MNKKILANDLFKDKIVPDFIKKHHLFIKPTKMEKIFPSIGLPNFQEKTAITKSFIDFKKEDNYVYQLFNSMYNIAYTNYYGSFLNFADHAQFLSSAEERNKKVKLIATAYKMVEISLQLSEIVSPGIPGALEAATEIVDGRVNIRLPRSISGKDGKIYVKKGASIFKVFNKIYKTAVELGIANVISLENDKAFKVFNTENIPNKEYSIIFSSEGEQGAWDIATMSMRGITSCQRWNGDYPYCLVGSIYSKFVGVMYLTSGTPAEKIGTWTNLGTKMIRRSVIRYAVEADEKKPCIIIDKMYPELDKEVLKTFTDTLHTKSNLPVYYAPDLGNKLKSFYIPKEKFRETITAKEWSYQDNPIKSKEDMELYILSMRNKDLSKDINGFWVKLSIEMSNVLSDIKAGNQLVSDSLKKLLTNMSINISLFSLAEIFSKNAKNYNYLRNAPAFARSKDCYRFFLRKFISERYAIRGHCSSYLIDAVCAYTSINKPNYDELVDCMMGIAIRFSKEEARKLSVNN